MIPIIGIIWLFLLHYSTPNMTPFISRLLKSAQGVFEKKFLYDIFKTFIGVLLAFWVNEWNRSRQSDFSEKTALQEIRQELDLNLHDLHDNIGGHQKGAEAAWYFWSALHGKPVTEDSLQIKYSQMLRNFVSIQHAAAYETVKSRGLEIIGDDSLRTRILTLFDFHLETIEKLEEKYAPHDFFKFYYHQFNEKLSPYVQISPEGIWSFRKPLSAMPEADKQQMKMWLQRLITDRRFMLAVYASVEEEVTSLQAAIDQKIVR